MHFDEFLTLPRTGRQIVVFADDKLVQFMEARGLHARRPGAREAFRLGGDGIDPLGVYNAVWRTLSEEINIRAIPESWAAKLGLSPGHPRRATAYAAHPVSTAKYLPIGDFHRLLFEQKIAELVSILASLGAISLEVECVEGWSEAMALSISIGLPHLRTGVGSGSSQVVLRRVLFQAQFRQRGPQELPRDLVWYPHEPLWQQLSNMRLSGALEEFSVRVEYRNDFGINAGLIGTIEQLGLELGGQFTKQESTVWMMAGKFG
jgi:hypothetical protein